MQETRAIQQRDGRVCQGDLLKDIPFVESVREEDGVLEVSRIHFPLVVVLSQDCDLEHDQGARDPGKQNQDKWLLSALVAPLYNAEHVYEGSHLSRLGRKMQLIQKSKTHGRYIQNNEIPRYHYLDFSGAFGLAPSVIDFKHYFGVPVEALHEYRRYRYVCSIEPLYRESVTSRFANYLSRIGLPESTRAPGG